MLNRVIMAVLVAMAVSATASAQERLPRAPEVAPSNAGDGRIRGIRGVPLDFEHLEDFWLRPEGSALPGRSR